MVTRIRDTFATGAIPDFFARIAVEVEHAKGADAVALAAHFIEHLAIRRVVHANPAALPVSHDKLVATIRVGIARSHTIGVEIVHAPVDTVGSDCVARQ